LVRREGTSFSSVHTLQPRRIAAIVLAAGGSSRFGSIKQLHRYEGDTLAQRAVRAALDTGVDEVVLVLGADADNVAESVGEDARVRKVINELWRSGLASSLSRGLSEIDPSFDGVLVTLADQPLVDSQALTNLVKTFDEDHRVIASQYGGTIGVPAIFGKEFLDELGGLYGDRGAGGWLRENIERVTVISLPAAELDIDTPQDAERLEEN
jgi:CTP:molybdopterin cytidylyltransferase MocA